MYINVFRIKNSFLITGLREITRTYTKAFSLYYLAFYSFLINHYLNLYRIVIMNILQAISL